MFKKLVVVLMSALMVFSLAACGGKSDPVDDMSYDEMLEAAKGTTVNFYGWGGDEQLNNWLKDEFSPLMKEKYDITMNIVPMDIDQILSKLSGEVEAGKEDGSIDMIWINGENFKSAKENDLLYGPFTEKMPNWEKYIDGDNDENNFDFGYPIEGYEAPYGKAQLVMINDQAVTPEQPANAKEFADYCKKYKGKVTYPALPDFTGSAFVRNLIYETCGGYEQFQDMKADKETVKKAIEPALEYLRALNPYLWKQGKTFPESSVQVEKMFMDGELVMYQTYSPYSIAQSIRDGQYPQTATSFVFDNGTIGNVNFMAIAKNSSNKAGAIVAINEMISASVQADRYATLGTLPVVDNSKLSDKEKETFASIKMGKGTLPQSELLAKRVPEMPSALVPIIEEIWLEEVVGK